MGVDESFVEYVAARWSMLYRLAVLLVGEPDADEVAQAALVRAYLAWSDVQEAASADDEVKKILATTAVRESREAAYEPEIDDGFGTPEAERLWATIRALPRRQRAVLVLRHYEGLSDAEIAGIVKSSTNAVTAEAGALEAGIDLADLRDQLARRAEDAVIPLPLTEALVAQGQQARRQRTRRATGRLVAVAGVVLVGLALATVVQSGTPDTPRPPRPTSTAPTVAEAPVFLSRLPRGAPAQIAYTERKFLHLPGGRGVVLDGTPAALVQTPQWVYVADLSGRIVRVDIATAEIQTAAKVTGGQLVASADGSQIGWLESGTGPAAVHVEWTDRPNLTGENQSRTFPAALRCCDNPFEVNGITEAGELIASLPAESRAWVSDTRGGSERVREISGLGNGLVSQVTASGLVVHYPPFQYAVGQLEDGAFLQVAELAALDADFSDPLGHRIVYADDTGEIHVRERDVRGRSRRVPPNVRLQLPLLDDGFAGVRWEDPDHVLLDVDDESERDGALVRCDVVVGACELADDLEGPHLLPH